jgi:hypothetical protein
VNTKFWRGLKLVENGDINSAQMIHYVNNKDQIIYDDQAKADLFASKLSDIYSPYNDNSFVNIFKTVVEMFVDSEELFDYRNNNEFEKEFTREELDSALKQLNKKAPGPVS